MIHVNALSKSYEDVRAVDGISFSVERGEIVGLVGPNGAGKTTTLRCLAGIIPPGEGTISIAGFNLADDPVPAKQRLAFVPDEPHLFDHLTSWDYLMLTARLYGVDDADRRATELLGQFDLQERRLAFPAELSRGMKQKLVIAAALLHTPDALVLDEPLTGLDPRAMRHMKDTIRAAADAGAAVLVSSHMLHLVEEVSHRLIVLHRGRIVLTGPMDEIRASMKDLGEGADLEQVFLRATQEGTDPA